MGKIPKAIVEEDFNYVVNNYIHGEFAQQLLNEWENENIRFQVTRDLEVDGETNLAKRKRRSSKDNETYNIPYTLELTII